MKIYPQPGSIYHSTDEVLKETVGTLESVTGMLLQKHTLPQVKVNSGTNPSFDASFTAPPEIAGKEIIFLDISAHTPTRYLKYHAGFIRVTPPVSPISGYRIPVGFIVTMDLKFWNPTDRLITITFDKVGRNSDLDNLDLFITPTIWIRRDW